MADLPRTAAAARLLPAAGGNAAVARLCERVARLLLVPSVQLSLLTDVEIVAGGAGLPEGSIGSEGPLDVSLCAAAAAFGGPLVISDAKDDARVADLPPIASGAVGAYLGVPLTVGGGAAVGALCVFDDSARPWSDHDVALLEQLAGAVIAELELSALSVDYEASRLLWDLASDATGLGSFDWDLRTDRVSMDERLQTLFGYAPGELVPHITAAFSRIHPEDRPTVDAAIAAAVEAVGDYRAEFRVNLPGGQQRWLVVRGRAVPSTSGPSVQLLGTAYDITEVRTGRDQAAHLRATMATGFLSVDGQWVVTHLNAAGERAVGMTAQELVGRELWEAFPDLEGLEFGLQCKGAAATGEPVEFESYYPHVDSWYEVRAVPAPDGMALYLLDITARRADRQRAEAATTLLELVATVSSGLATAALETDAAVAALARLVVPALADWCLVSLVDDDGSLRHVGCWHVDPDLLPAVEAFAAHCLEDVEQPAAVHRARRSRQPVITAHGAMALALDVLQSPAAIAAITQLAPESSVVLPLVAHHTVLGVLTLCRGAARPLMSNEEITTAGEVAARAGLALDNARLYAEQRSLAEGLQRLVLADPPESNHGEIAVRYVPAAELAAVGGDWFDAFCQPDGATTLVIGDVVGHDTAAAAAMVEVRGLLRGIAWHTGSGPAEVLRGVDAAIEGLQVATTATAIVARLEQTPSERERGATRLRWSNAGHPPPMAIDADGNVVILPGSEVDLLLGFEPRTSRIQSEITLDQGATVLLYTDGLIEHRGEDLDTGLARLRDTLRELANLPLDKLCDELLLRMKPAADDDVAFIAVRLPAQHQPVHSHDDNAPTGDTVERTLPNDTRGSARSGP
ncbi:SpoIIE family protein phosphatase [Sporichthya sp.]|uniref:SpoIIE family protein phosphatase n=1 Tax=Sporichthya sp. TaxID=65475 RepID=UPI0017D31639|nr:SpoIIE family protein phosphatase [Sporichthya sp.]MBA3741899.1 SpoIIE family protein phosphatase [Sporichthya sp.]